MSASFFPCLNVSDARMDQPVLPPNPSSTLFWTVRGIVFVFSIIGNGLVVYLMLTRTHQLLKVISNWFILSLAIADLLVTVVVFVPEVYFLCLRGNIFPWTFKLFYDMLTRTSCYNLCALTFERYIAVVEPLKYGRLTCKKRLIAFTITAMWFLGIISPLPYYICFRLRQFSAFRAVMLVFLFTGEFLPTAILVLAYAKIIIVVRRQERMVKRQNDQVSYNYGTAFVQKNRYDKRNRSNVQVLGAILFVFVLCYSVSCYKGFINYVLFREVSYWTVYITRILYQLNSAVNGFVYALLKKDIKQEINKIAYKMSNGRIGRKVRKLRGT